MTDDHIPVPDADPRPIGDDSVAQRAETGVAAAPVSDLDDPVVAGLGRAIDPPGRIGQAASRLIAWLGHFGPEAWVTLAIVGGCVLFVFTQLSPPDIFSSSTPAGGDMGAHVWGPAYMRDHLLPSFRLTGWTPDWYAGFPAYQFYMVLPSLAIALLSYILPYGIAFKLVAISGALTLPIACWAFGRLTRLPFPVSPLLAVAGTAFLFDRSFSIYGGNLASTLAGEFAFSISLSLAIVFLGLVGRGLDTGRQRVIAPIVLALTGLCHLIPFLFAIGGATVWLLVSLARRSGIVRRVWWLACTGVVGVALMSWWLLPFYLRSGYMNDMGWEKKTNYADLLFQRKTLDPQLVNSPPIQWVLVFALLGLVMSIAWKRRGGIFLGLLAGATAIAFIYLPQGKLWNARLLPFWYLMLYMLAAIGVAELGRTVASLLSRDPDTPRRSITIATAIVGALAGITMIAMPLRAMPTSIALGPLKVDLGGVESDGKYHWLFLSTKESSFIPSWARWNFTGYEGKPAYPEYHDIVQTMADLGETNGCGRAMWEHEEQHDRYGTPMALMLLPFWTDGCIGSMEGLYFEASSTTPYHFINQDELSFGASNAQRDLPYHPGGPDKPQFDLGIQHLQMLGVKYYMAITEQMQTFAAQNTSLTQVATSGPWKVYEVSDSELVAPLDNEPAVLTGVDTKHGWLDAVMPWYIDQGSWNVWPASGGPAAWQRLAPGEQAEPIPTTPIAVTNIAEGNDTISFDVSRVGTPVVVRASYFPNWKVSGAEGPWRIGPNLMVVVPTSEHVSLNFGMTTVDWGSWFVTLLGIVGIVLLWRAGPLVLPEPTPWRRPRPTPDGDDETDGESSETGGGDLGTAVDEADPNDVAVSTDAGSV